MLTRGGPMIWPLRTKLFQPVFYQRRPKWTANQDIPVLVAVRPWDAGRPGMVGAITGSYRYVGPIPNIYPWPNVVHQLLPLPPTYFRISGTTRDWTGTILGNCVVDWFNTADDVKIDSTTSDANGFYEFRTAGQPPNAYYLVAYKVGSPDVAGTTRNDLVGT